MGGGIFKQNRQSCYWFGGELDKAMRKSVYVIPEAHFSMIKTFGSTTTFSGKTAGNRCDRHIHELRSLLKIKLHQFIETFQIWSYLIAENALSIPMHVPLGLALTETIAETQIPTIAHHHDFYWERIRFSVNAVSDYLRMAFPPNLPNIKHAVINSDAQEQLAAAWPDLLHDYPQCLDFDNPPRKTKTRARVFPGSPGSRHRETDRFCNPPALYKERDRTCHRVGQGAQG